LQSHHCIGDGRLSLTRQHNRQTVYKTVM